MVSAAPIKNPDKQRAGKLGAESRWGPGPRVVRLDSLSTEQRAIVLALVAAAKKAPAPAKADAQEVRRVRVDHHHPAE